MKRRRFATLALTATFLLLLGSGGGVSQEKAAGPETATVPCRTIAAILSVYPSLEVRISEGAVRENRQGLERSGCRVFSSGPTAGMAGEVPPDHPLRFLLGEAGWEEDPRYTADGPGTTSFVLRRNGVRCLFSGGAHSWIENGTVKTSETFEFEARCGVDPGQGEAAPDR